jgi:hypothetical protein
LFTVSSNVGYYVLGGFIDWMITFHAGLFKGAYTALSSSVSFVMSTTVDNLSTLTDSAVSTTLNTLDSVAKDLMSSPIESEVTSYAIIETRKIEELLSSLPPIDHAPTRYANSQDTNNIISFLSSMLGEMPALELDSDSLFYIRIVLAIILGLVIAVVAFYKQQRKPKQPKPLEYLPRPQEVWDNL